MAHGLVATVLLPALISSLGINQEPYISLGFRWTLLNSLGLTWAQLDPLGFTCIHLGSLGMCTYKKQIQ